MSEWRKIAEALGHRPFNPESEEYRCFIEKTKKQIEEMAVRWNNPLLAQHKNNEIQDK